MKKYIEIMLVSKGISGMLNEDGMSVYGDGYIRKTIIKKELVNQIDNLTEFEVKNICKDITGVEPTLCKLQLNKGKNTYEVRINDRLSFLALATK